MLRVLIADGNDREGRAQRTAVIGRTTAESYEAVIRQVRPGTHCTLFCPADADARLPMGMGLDDFDGLVLTGSTLRVTQDVPAVHRQIALMRAAFEAGLPTLGSCWGLQVAAVAAGGEAAPNPRGPEYGLARRIAATEAGRGHPLLAGRPAAWDAPAIHCDAVVRPPPGATVLAANAVLDVQAMEIRHGRGVFRGTQYHPETDLDELSAMLGLRASDVMEAAFAPDVATVEAYCRDLAALHAEDGQAPAIAWRLGIGPDVLCAGQRRREIANFLHSLRGS